MALENSCGEPSAEPASASASPSRRKKLPYEKPTFRHEKVFVTSALHCGKVDPTDGQCHFVRKS
jgi:hypothetical protein